MMQNQNKLLESLIARLESLTIFYKQNDRDRSQDREIRSQNQSQSNSNLTQTDQKAFIMTCYKCDHIDHIVLNYINSPLEIENQKKLQKKNQNR